MLIAGAALLIASCSSGAGSSQATIPAAPTAATVLEPVTTSSSLTTSSSAATVRTTIPVDTIPIDNSTTAAPLTTAGPGAPPPVATATTSAPPAPTDTPSTALAAATTIPAGAAGGTAYGMPIEPGVNVGYAHEHHDYPASDIFAGGCGTAVVSPVNGTLLQVRRENLWTAAADNPATRGGKSISLLGDDGVRYYFAHFEQIQDGLAPGDRVVVGGALGRIGMTGRAGACHLHFALSPPCPGKEWSVRRGVIWPWPYLDAWRQGRQLSPADEIAQWSSDHPDACADAMADPNAADS